MIPDENKNTAYTKLSSVGEKLHLTVGQSALVTLGALYLTIAFVFSLVFMLTIPRTSNQVYNVSVSSEDYDASLRIEVEHFLRPLQINMACTAGSQEIQILYDVEDRLIAYKHERHRWCYIRAGAGLLFQKDMQNFKDLIMGKRPLRADSKQTVHLLLLPTPVPTNELENMSGNKIINFCKGFKSFWLTHYYNGISDNNVDDFQVSEIAKKQRRRNLFHRTRHIDICFQNLVIHHDATWFMP